MSHKTTNKNTFETNEYGYVQYPKNHLGRDINILKAIYTLDSPTASLIAEQVGSTNATVARTIQRLNSEALIRIESTDSGYKVIKASPIYSKKIVLNYDKNIELR